MDNLERFKQEVNNYLHQGISPNERKKRPTQADLAMKCSLADKELNRRLNGKSKLQPGDVQRIVRGLAELRCIKSREQAQCLLALMDVPDFNPADWNVEPLEWLDEGSRATKQVFPSLPPPEQRSRLSPEPVMDMSQQTSEPSHGDAAQIPLQPRPPVFSTLLSRRKTIMGLVAVAAVGTTWLAWSRHILRLPFPLTHVYLGHTDHVTSVAWSPNGEYIVSGSWDKTAQVWKATTGNLIYTFRRHFEQVWTVAWSHNGEYIASGSWNKMAWVWHALTGIPVCTYHSHADGVWCVAWSPDDVRIASGSWDTTARVWYAATGREICVYSGHTGHVDAVAWSPNGIFIASASTDGTARVWDAATGKHVQTTYSYHADMVHAVAWSPDGKWIASGSSDTTVQLWDAMTGNPCLTYQGHSSAVRALAWSPDGKYIASGGDDETVRVWDPITGNTIYTYRGHWDAVSSIAWSPDSRQIASGGGADMTVQVWNVP